MNIFQKNIRKSVQHKYPPAYLSVWYLPVRRMKLFGQSMKINSEINYYRRKIFPGLFKSKSNFWRKTKKQKSNRKIILKNIHIWKSTIFLLYQKFHLKNIVVTWQKKVSSAGMGLNIFTHIKLNILTFFTSPATNNYFAMLQAKGNICLPPLPTHIAKDNYFLISSNKK